jgi:hypothetical protein
MDSCLLDKGSLGYFSSLDIGQSRFQGTECEAISRIRVILQNQQHNYDVLSCGAAPTVGAGKISNICLIGNIFPISNIYPIGNIFLIRNI